MLLVLLACSTPDPAPPEAAPAPVEEAAPAAEAPLMVPVETTPADPPTLEEGPPQLGAKPLPGGLSAPPRLGAPGPGGLRGPPRLGGSPPQ